MHEPIPARYLPPKYLQRRWPELADLENNPLFLAWLQRRNPRRRLKAFASFWIALLLGFVSAASLIAALIIFEPRLGIPAPLLLPVAVFLFFWPFAMRHAQLLSPTRPNFASRMLELQSPVLLGDLYLTPVDGRTLAFGALAPRLSRLSLVYRALAVTVVLSPIGLCLLVFIPLWSLALNLATAIAVIGCYFHHIESVTIQSFAQQVKQICERHYHLPGSELHGLESFGCGFSLLYIPGALTLAYFLFFILRENPHWWLPAIVLLAAIYVVHMLRLAAAHAPANLHVAAHNCRKLLEAAGSQEWRRR